MNGQVHDERNLFVFGSYDAVGKPVTPETYEATIRTTYGANAQQVLARYPVASFVSPSAALGRVLSDAATYTRLKVYRQLAQYVRTYVYEFNELETPQFYSIFRLQQQGEPARSFPFGATHVDDLPYLWEYLGHSLPFTDDQLELSDQMIEFWSTFQVRGNPNAAPLPRWPRFNRSEQWMSLNACETSEASDEPPAACSEATTGYMQDHKLDFWESILG